MVVKLLIGYCPRFIDDGIIGLDCDDVVVVLNRWEKLVCERIRVAAIEIRGRRFRIDLESAVELEALVAAVRTLPQKTQQVLILRKVYSWPVERIAERALLSEAAVLRHLATAARELAARDVCHEAQAAGR